MDLQRARRKRGWSQKEAAARLGVSQPYLSMLERGERPVPSRWARKLMRLYGLSPVALPLPRRVVPADNQRLAEDLAQLGYPSFAYLRTRRRMKNPSEVLLSALAMDDCEARLLEALPWLLLRYDVDVNWLAQQARLHNLQNRLGFVVNLARRVAETTPKHQERVTALRTLERELERSRLANTDTLCDASLGAATRRWLEQHRPPEAAHWHLLADWRPEHLRHVS